MGPTEELLLHLPYRPPLAWGRLLSYLAARAIPGVEHVSDATYRRTFALPEHVGCLAVRPLPGRFVLEARVRLPKPVHEAAVSERIGFLFDLAADPRPIARHLRRDRVLARAVFPGLRVPGAWDGFELAVRAILGQQVTVKGASTLAGRLVDRFGERLPQVAGHGLSHVFPRPEVLAKGDLTPIGLPRARARTIQALAAAVCDGRVVFRASGGLGDPVRRLRALPGIGAWTAQYIALRALRDGDAFPSSDLGLRRALARRGVRPSPRALEARAEAWRPWRGYAAMALWMSEGAR